MQRLRITVLFAAFVLGCAAEGPVPVSEPPANLYIEEGRALVKGLAACGFCHGEKSSPQAVLSGGQTLYDVYGEVKAPNITPAEGALKGWTAGDFIKLFRTGETPREDTIVTELHRGFEWMADRDILAIVSYIKNLPPIRNDVDRRSIGIIDRNTTGFFQAEKEVAGHVPVIARTFQIEYGQYLADNVARCGVCHTMPASLLSERKYLAGGKLIKNENGEKYAPNITQAQPGGIGSWSHEEIVLYLKSGAAPGGRESDSDFCPTEFYANAPEEDLIALAKYLKTVPALN